MSHDAHDFESVILFLRHLRAKGAWGTTEIVWRGQEITFVKQNAGYKPGELPT